jgi:multidrug resistance efflux pump
MVVFKLVRAVFGFGALAAGGWTLAATYADSGGVDAILNGRMTIVRAPTDGYFVPLSTPLGDVVRTGAKIASLKPVPDSAQTTAQWAIQSRSEIESLKSQISTLQGMSGALRDQANAHREARLKLLAADLGAQRENVAAMEARARQAEVVLSRDRRYYAKSPGSGATVQSDRFGESAATLEWQAAKERLEAKQAELAAAGDNAFVGDGYASASYSQQRADQIDLQLVGLKAELMRREAEVAGLNDAMSSDGGSAKLPAASLTAPASGVLWKISGATGQFVKAGEEVAEIVDCSHFITTVTVADRAYGGVGAGQRVTLKSEGQQKEWTGEVVWAGAAEGDVAQTLNLALRPSVPSNARYAFVALLDKAPDDADACPIGKRGRLYFDGMSDFTGNIADAFKKVGAKVSAYLGGSDDKLARD